MARSNSSVVLNPDTPLAFLPPDLANQLQVYRYFAVTTLGVFAWNTLSHTDVHYKLLFRSRITLATVVYFASIIMTALYTCCCVAFHAGLVDNCQAVLTAVASAYAAAIPITAVLFLLRIHGVSNGQPIIMGFFVFCWLGLLGTALTLPFSLSGSHIGPTSYCIDTGFKPFGSSPIIASTVFDSLVFSFITWRLLDNAVVGDSFRDKIRTFFGRGALPAVSRALLSSGQVYYLITVCTNTATTVMLLSPSVPLLFHALLAVPNSALTCMMACKVYRDVRFGSHKDDLGFSSSFWQSSRSTQTSSSPPELPTVRIEKHTFGGIYPSQKEVTLQPESLESFSLSQVSNEQYYKESHYMGSFKA